MPSFDYPESTSADCPDVPTISDSSSMALALSKQLLEITSQIEQMQMHQRSTSERVQTLEVDMQVLKGTKQTYDNIDKDGSSILPKEAQEDMVAIHASNKSDAQIVWDQSHYHYLRKSVWEMAIVVHLGILSLSATIQFICAFLLNVFLQGVISVAMITSFGSDRIDIESLDVWRRTVGHNYREADSISGRSLVSRICALDSTLGTFSAYLSMLEDYERYSTFGGIGEWLAAVVVLVWILTVIEDILACISFVDGISSLPTARYTRVMSTRDPARRLVKFEFVEMSARHRACLLFLSLLRVSVTALLLIPGSIWLATEYEINDLLLNCCALGFVFALDEMCFDIVAPLDMQTLAENFRPLPKIRNERWNTLLLPKIPPLFFGALLFLYMLFVHIIPTKQYLIDIHDSLCSGRRDFVYGVNVDTKLMIATERRSGEDGTGTRESLVVKDLIDKAVFESVAGVVHIDNFASLRAQSEVSMAVFTEARMLSCADVLHTSPKFALEALQRYNANPSATTCEGLKASCFEIEQKLLRLVCPVTCGAASPRSGQFLDRRAYGVKREMCFATETYQDAFAAIPCFDPSPEALMAMPGWTRAWNLMVEYWGRFSSELVKCYQGVADSFLSKGCDALSLYHATNCMQATSLDLCTDSIDLIHLARFCPVACGCLGVRKNHSACPPTCSR